MDKLMSRLILVPQYPARMRYQEWWWEEFPKQLHKYFDDVVVLGKYYYDEELWPHERTTTNFSSWKPAIDFETKQIWEFIHKQLKPDDTLLLNDLSFPGLFAHALFHKRPKRCYTICHASSKNRYDYFARDRKMKYPIEKNVAKLFDGVFVATEYHKQKLGWKNVFNVGLPDPPLVKEHLNYRPITFISASRFNIQKRTRYVEKAIENEFGELIQTTQYCTSWRDYYEMLCKSQIMVITSKEETYGYQVVDAISCGCNVVAPKKYSYPELLPKSCLYENVEQCLDLIKSILQKSVPVPVNLMQNKVDHFYENISKIMQS